MQQNAIEEENLQSIIDDATSRAEKKLFLDNVCDPKEKSAVIYSNKRMIDQRIGQQDSIFELKRIKLGLAPSAELKVTDATTTRNHEKNFSSSSVNSNIINPNVQDNSISKIQGIISPLEQTENYLSGNNQNDGQNQSGSNSSTIDLSFVHEREPFQNLINLPHRLNTAAIITPVDYRNKMLVRNKIKVYNQDSIRIHLLFNYLNHYFRF